MTLRKKHRKLKRERLGRKMDKKIEVAKELGLNVVDVKEKDPVEAVKEWTDGRGVDAVIMPVG